VIRAGAAGAALVGPVVYAAVAAERAAELVAVIGGFGIALVVVGAIVRIPEVLPLGLAFVGIEYGLFLTLGDQPVAVGVPLIAAALLAGAELAYSALEPPLVPAPPALRVRRAARWVGLVGGGAGVAAVVLLVSVADLGGAAGLRLLGLAAAVATLGLLALLARASA
jgi:hypothetical protein